MVGYDVVIQSFLALIMLVIGWKIQSNGKKLDKLTVDMAVVKKITEHVSPDHDLLQVVNYRAGEIEKDLNGIGSKIKKLEGE